jgi:hypothetical protein
MNAGLHSLMLEMDGNKIAHFSRRCGKEWKPGATPFCCAICWTILWTDLTLTMRRLPKDSPIRKSIRSILSTSGGISVLDGRIIGSEFEGWPATIDCERFRLAFMRYNKERHTKLWMHEDAKIGKLLKHSTPSLKRQRGPNPAHAEYLYLVPSLDVCRAEWAVFINHHTEWEGL